jgi:hypothetical protein
MNETDFTANNGQLYLIKLDDSGEKIYVYQDGKKLGSISLSCIEEGDHHVFEVYKITYLDLESCKGLGIGRRCLQFHQDVYDAPLIAGDDNGTKSDDGSHLIGDGPGFISKMRAEGIVLKNSNYYDYNHFDD